jgi:anthranilate synthase/aminodeoxychorismate synthase-like glutamine amidotransferase
MTELLLIDNYDSFVHNLARYFVELGCETRVVRNDSITVADIRRMSPAAIVISPGPCTPRQAGVSCELIRELGAATPMLGVCLGHQAMAEALGGRVIRAQEPVHGRTSMILHDGTKLSTGIPSPFRATRYHSLVVEEATLPDELVITARTQDGIPMAMAHRQWPLYGVQFHPESVLTQHGRTLLINFLDLAKISHSTAMVEDWTEPPELESRGESCMPPVPW